MASARRIFVVSDGTHKSIEEIATEVMRIVTGRTGVEKSGAAGDSAI